MIKKYETISTICGFIGIAIMFIAMFSVVYFLKVANEDSSSSFWKSLAIMGVAMLMMIPMIIYSNKAFNLCVEEVKNKSDKELEEWIEDMTKQGRVEYVTKVMNKIGGYEKKWIKK